MKKSLAAVAVLGAFAGSAFAADLQLYGVGDTGLVYQHANSYDALGVNIESEDTFGMSTGVASGSRWGMKGTEDLGNRLTVGFVLENGFSSDTGSLTQGGRMFGREAQLFIRSGFGELSMGRVGNLNSGNGTYGLTAAISPFGTTWGEYSAAPNNVMAGFDRYDNTITYKSPNFAGFNVYLQYSMDTDSTAKNDGAKHGEENKSSVDRYYALGLTYANGPLNLVAVVDQTNYSSWTRQAAPNYGTDDVNDALTVTLGGSYDFEVTKVYAGAQYFDQVNLDSIDRWSNDMFSMAQTGTDRFEIKGFGLNLGADVPLGGGVFKVGTAFMKGTLETVNGWAMSEGGAVGEIDLTRWNTSVGYQYNLSKRTSLYGVASYSYNKIEGDKPWRNVELDADPSIIEAAVGLVHKF